MIMKQTRMKMVTIVTGILIVHRHYLMVNKMNMITKENMVTKWFPNWIIYTDRLTDRYTFCQHTVTDVPAVQRHGNICNHG